MLASAPQACHDDVKAPRPAEHSPEFIWHRPLGRLQQLVHILIRGRGDGRAGLHLVLRLAAVEDLGVDCVHVVHLCVVDGKRHLSGLPPAAAGQTEQRDRRRPVTAFAFVNSCTASSTPPFGRMATGNSLFVPGLEVALARRAGRPHRNQKAARAVGTKRDARGAPQRARGAPLEQHRLTSASNAMARHAVTPPRPWLLQHCRMVVVDDDGPAVIDGAWALRHVDASDLLPRPWPRT